MTKAALQGLDATTLPLRTADISGRSEVPFHLAPGAGARTALADELGVRAVRKLDFRGTLTPDGRQDWRLTGRLGATVVQDCVLSAQPVTTRLDLDIVRRFLRHMPEPTGVEAEIPEDDTLEPLGPVIDPGAVMTEALLLALPDYPRAPGATLPEAALGDAPRENPFAALAALKRDDV